jgi:serine phosphatase RsbU (regulator of sigma subunit)
MAQGGIVRRLDGIGEKSVGGTLATLLSLTSDAVIAFDGLGRVLLSNDTAALVFPHPSGGLVGCDVRSCFPLSEDADPDAPFCPDDLPFPMDGSSKQLVCQAGDGSTLDLTVRCDRVPSAGETYLLVAVASDAAAQAERENDRLVQELSRANKRLSGTLGIVLGTLDSGDVMTLFSRALEEITNTMEASGTVFYVAEQDGYHLRGVSKSLAGARVPRYLSFGQTIDALAKRAGRALRLRVLPPKGDELRRGRLTNREVVNEETQEVYRLRAGKVPPFTSFIAVPVWFGGQVIALIEVGWEQARPLQREDSELLDAVAQYLSVQLVGAFSALRARRDGELRDSASQVRETLMEAGDLTPESRREVTDEVERALDATCVEVRLNQRQGNTALVTTPAGEDLSVPLDFEQVQRLTQEDGTAVMPLEPDDAASRALADAGMPGTGAYVGLGRIGDDALGVLVLRPSDGEPLDESELRYLGRVASDLQGLARGEERRKQDKRISQALQTGMRNELQQVDGITARGIYSSATATAVIGGDFYDLIRLPDRRACVIMGDVSGKGVEAASVSAAVKTALGAYSWQGLSPARMVRLLNEFLLGFSRLETFATLFVGIVDLGSGMLSYCSAGHPPAILVRAATGEIETLDVQSGVVGAFHEMTYRNGRVRLRRGDVLLLYTDGTTEARAADGSFFGEDGLRDAVMREVPRGYDGLLERLLAMLDSFTERHLDDDVAMVSLRFDMVGPLEPPRDSVEVSGA